MNIPTNLADPGRRFLAYLIDALIVGVASSIIMGLSMIPLFASVIAAETTGGDVDTVAVFSSMGLMLLGVLAIYILVFFYFAIQHSSKYQATVGKRAMKLYVTDMAGNRLTFGKAALRVVGRFINGMTMLIGWIIILFTDRKQGLHDLLASTLVLDGNQDQNLEDEEVDVFYSRTN